MFKSNIESDYQEPVNELSRKRGLLYLAVIGFAVAGVIILLYLFMTRTRVYVEKSQIMAPTIDLSSQNGGILEKMLVSAGENISENTPVAQVGNDIIRSKDAGMVISTKDDIGKNFAPNEAVVSMIKPSDLRVIAQTEEDKGLANIKVGQKAIFTVDAFGSKKYEGIVDEVSPSARQVDVVFNISSQRQLNEFDVKIRYDHEKYPELRNGMSAKSWIYTD